MKLNYFATSNQHKLQEFNHILGLKLEQIKVDLLEPQGLDVSEVVKFKAKDAYDQSGKSVLVEDTGLEIVAWNGLPGALIKWFLDSVGTAGIVEMLGDSTDRRAIAKTAVSYCHNNQTYVFIGQIEGQIAEKEVGENGFGWDSIFMPNGYDKTFAQMTNEEKSECSMRKLALDQLKLHLENSQGR